MPTKVCRTCQQELPVTSFTLRKDRGTYRADCKSCHNAKQRADNAVSPSKPLPEEKFCRGCEQTLSIDHFARKGLGRVQARCRHCCSKTQKVIRDRYAARSADEMPVITEKLCRECNQLLPASAYGVVLSAKDGLKPYCKPCESKRHNAWVDSSEERIEKRRRDSKQWRKANPEQFKTTQRAWMERNWDRVLEYTNANTRRYRELYPERYVEARKRLTASGKGAAYKRKRDAAKLAATPPWLDLEDLFPLYELAQQLSADSGEPWEVDHVDPLQAELVCGLHCFENLQVLPRGENRAKQNKFTPYRIDADGERYELSGEEWLIVK